MTSNQKTVAAWVAIAALLGAVLYLAILYWRLDSGDLVNDPDGPNPVLHQSWRIALWFIELGTAVKVIFATLLTVLSAAVAAAVEIYQRKRQILAIVILCAAGVVLCVLNIVSLGDEAILQDLGFYSKYDSNAALKDAANIFFYSLIGWFSAFMALQLGIRVTRGAGSASPPPSRKRDPKDEPHTPADPKDEAHDEEDRT